MVIKQGISTTDEGRGALSSSYDVMVKLGQVPAGIMWGALFTAFANAKPGTFLGQIGPTPFPRPSLPSRLSNPYLLTGLEHGSDSRQACSDRVRDCFSRRSGVGLGGHCIVAAMVRGVAMWFVKSIPEEELFLSDDSAKTPRR